MNVFEPIHIGFEQIRLHKLRAALSILGILISVGSVTGIVSMGDGLRLTVMEQFQKMGGANRVEIRPPEQWYRKGTRWVRRDWEEYITNRDSESFMRDMDHIRFVVPVMNLDTDIKYKNVSTYASVRGSNEHYHLTENWSLGTGRLITADDVANAKKVAVIGHDLAHDLYGDENPLGKELKIQGTRMVVVGVLAQMNNTFGGTNARYMIIPYTTAQRRYFGNNRIDRLIVWLDAPEFADDAAWQMRTILKRSHDHAAEFRVETGANEIDRFNRVVTILKIVAGGIAGISLIVGGIGIMNIMLVSVTERTREIGIRMALGATRRSILSQFVIEAIVLCLAGGMLGILLGTGIGFGISVYVRQLTHEPFVSIITPGLMAFAIGYSAAIGLFFGVYPAFRASKLDPVEALRYE